MNDDAVPMEPPVAGCPSLFRTVRDVLVSPKAFFADPPSGVGRAIAVAVGVRVVADLVGQLGLRFAGYATGEDVAHAAVLAPFVAVLSVYGTALIAFLVATISQGTRPRFGLLFRVAAYAQIAFVLNVVPVIGPVIALPYWLWLTATGLRVSLGRPWWFGWAGVLTGPAAAVLLGLGVRTLLVEAFKLPSPSMAPTLVSGDHVFVSKSAYGFFEKRPPELGDLVVFPSPEHPEQDFIKRVVGLPGQTLTFVGGVMYINGWPVPRCRIGTGKVAMGDLEQGVGEFFVEYLNDRAYLVFHDSSLLPPGDDETTGPYVVAPGEVFVVGDNRERSYDGRMWFDGRGGGVSVQSVKGKVWLIWMSFQRHGGIAWPRIGRRLHEPPPCDAALSAEACAGLQRCLQARPPASATVPPKSRAVSNR